MCQNTTKVVKPNTTTNTTTTTTTTASDATPIMASATSSLITTDYSIINNNQTEHETHSKDDDHQTAKARELVTTTSTTQKIIYLIGWLILTYSSKEFAKFLSIHQSQAAALTFIPASYQYDDENTMFDNTFLTYGTDFMICIFMTLASYKCYSTHTGLGYKGCALFGSYAVSVFCGGYAHFTFRTLDSMNTLWFKAWWIVCVGTVTAAGGFMGMCGSEILLFFQLRQQLLSSSSSSTKRFSISHVSNSLWWIYGIYMTIVCIMGEISYKRPACDIFVAGTTQFPPTVFCVISLLSLRWNDAIPGLEGSTKTSSLTALTRKVRILFYIGFMLNAPLLPSYPLLVQYTNLPLGVVNALLHLNLTCAWGMQAWSVYQVSTVIKKETAEEKKTN